MEKNQGVAQESVFKSMFGKYEVPKTLRFELKPVGKTAEHLKQAKVFEKDKLVDDHYHQIKYYFDAFHRKFINESLRNVSFTESDILPYYETLKKFKTSNKDEKKKIKITIEKEQDKLREEIVKAFDITGNTWKEKFLKHGVEFNKEGVEILFEDAVLEALEKEFPTMPADDKNAPAISFTDPVTGKLQNLFRSFDGFFTYFSNFNETKKNLYSTEDHDTAVANRAINENLRQFIENKIQLEDLMAEYRECGVTDEELEKFNLKSYNSCLSQDGIDCYNQIIGRVSDDPSDEGLNQKINQFNQKNKGKKLPHFAQLFKQILSKRDIKERSLEITETSQVFPLLNKFIELNDNKLAQAQKIMSNLFGAKEKYDLNKIYLKNSALNTISQKWFSNWSVVARLLIDTKKKIKNGEDDAVKLPTFVPIAELKNALETCSSRESEQYIEPEDLFRSTYSNVYKKTSTHYETFVEVWKAEWQTTVNEYLKNKQIIIETLQRKKGFSTNDENTIQEIRLYGESALAIFQIMKYFALEKGKKKIQPDNGIDNIFYNPFNSYYEEYDPSDYFDEIRNFVSAKPYLGRLLFPSFSGKLEQRDARSKRILDGAEKIKMNFDNGVLLSGWDRNKESDYYGIILRDDTSYYLAVMTKDCHDLFRDQNEFKDETSTLYKMEYRQLNNVFRQLPRIAFALKNREKYGVTTELEHIRDDFRKYQEAKKKDKKLSFDQNKIQKIIELYKKVLNDSFGKDFDFGNTLSATYASLNDFYTTVEKKTYSLKFFPIKKNYIDKALNSGKMFLFEISNKDLKIKKESKETFVDNLHTIYFKAIFDSENAVNPVFKLSGGAEIFFRPKTDSLKVDEKTKKIEHKRYSEDKIFVHMPILINMGAGDAYGLNNDINSLIADDKDKKIIKIIGIDRGEKHLGYLAVVDQDGKLVSEPKNLDGILPNNQTYLKKLEEKAENRDSARKEWKTIEKIKELKNGYISQVVHDLTDLMFKENAILVFEDLNSGFKRSRQKIEQQVYQKLELALAKKLNYLVDKKATKGNPGHFLKGLQLTPPIKTFQDIGKQCGTLFYVSPAYTSLTCPECGYRKNVSFSFENMGKAKKHIKDINLYFKQADRNFEITYTLNNQGKKKAFKVSCSVERLRWHRNGTAYAKQHNPGEEVVKNTETHVGLTKKYKLNECFEALFASEPSLIGKKELLSSDLTKIENSDFYRQLFRYLEILLHSRNSISGTDIDYIQCPRCLFHSDNGFCGFKYNGDANGAFNIARKGLLALRKIQQAEDPENIKWADLKVDMQEWDEFVSSEWERKNGV